jgi:uncharacterized membrane protein YgdD (TMEM256/DUF423 family)
MNYKKIWIIISAISGFTAVAIGAFGAHILRENLSTEMLEVYKTGVIYQFVHTLVLLILALSNFNKSKIVSIFFLLGIILFSFSLYVYSISEIKFIAMITPVGGLCFLIGWFWLIVETIKNKVLK